MSTTESTTTTTSDREERTARLRALVEEAAQHFSALEDELGPGIAEALLATAIGLVAAIPAVVIYNVFARAITGYRLQLANAAASVRRLVSRDLDFRGAPAARVDVGT